MYRSTCDFDGIHAFAANMKMIQLGYNKLLVCLIMNHCCNPCMYSMYLCMHIYFPWLNYEHRCFMNALFACRFQFSNHNKNRNVFTMLFSFYIVLLILILERSIVHASDILYLCLQIASRKEKAMITAAKYYDMLYKNL